MYKIKDELCIKDGVSKRVINELIENYNLEVSQNEIIKSFLEKLTIEFGHGFNVLNLKKMKKFYLNYKDSYKMWHKQTINKIICQ